MCACVCVPAARTPLVPAQQQHLPTHTLLHYTLPKGVRVQLLRTALTQPPPTHALLHSQPPSREPKAFLCSEQFLPMRRSTHSMLTITVPPSAPCPQARLACPNIKDAAMLQPVLAESTEVRRAAHSGAGVQMFTDV